MELKKEFAHMVDRMGLEDAELSLAEIVWQKAERAMQGLPVQEAVLLKEQFVFAPERTTNELTREEVQFMCKFITELLNTGQENMKRLRSDIQAVWLLCDPDDDKTSENFVALNNLRTYQRRVSPMLRKLEKIQHKLKKQR